MVGRRQYTSREVKLLDIELPNQLNMSTRFAVARKACEDSGIAVWDKDDEEIRFAMYVSGYQDSVPYDIFYLDEIEERFGQEETQKIISELMAAAAGVIFVLR